MFCKNCGKEFEGKYCPLCGTKAEIPAAPAKIKKPKKSKKKLILSIIALILIFCVVVLPLMLVCLIGGINLIFFDGSLFKSGKTSDKNETGEIYYSQIEKEHIAEDDKGNMYADNEILLVAADGTRFADIKSLAKKHGAEIAGYIEITGDYQLKFNNISSQEELEELLETLNNSPLVESAYINYVCYVDVDVNEERNGFYFGDKWKKDLQNFNDCKGKSWGIEAIEVLASWDILNANKKNVDPVKVGLIDCGFDTDHKDLGFAEVFYNNVNRRDHGTHVAGTMAAKTDNKEGICGVYPYGEGNLYGVSFDGVESYTENIVTSMSLKIAYSELILRDVKVINTSWGYKYKESGLKYTDPEWDDMVDYLESNSYILGDFLNRLLNKGYDFVLVNSAGNNSDRKNNIIYDCKYNFWTTVISEEDYPDVYNRIIVVGAVDSNYEICNFSNGGDRVDIYAPGENIYSTVPNSKYSSKNWRGTSMASPHVAGVAASVWSVNNDLTGAQVKEIVCSNSSFRCNSCDMVDAYMAVQQAAHMKTSESGEEPKNGGILCWVVSAEDVDFKIADATVTVTNTSTNEQYSTTTDAMGHFELFVPKGRYNLTVSAEGYRQYVLSEPVDVQNNGINYLGDWIKMKPENNMFMTDISPADPAATEISTARELYEKINADPDGSFVLKCDIDLSTYNNGRWVPLCDNYDNRFTGTLDGQGYTIENLNCYDTDNAGLFGRIDNATVKNLGIEAIKISGSTDAAVIAVFGNGTVYNCYVICDDISSKSDAGGLFASDMMGQTVIEYVTVYANVTSNVKAEYSLSQSLTAYGTAGGLIGCSAGDIKIKDVLFEGNVKCTHSGKAEYGYSDAGGLIGKSSSSEELIISRAVVKGSVVAETSYGSKRTSNSVTLFYGATAHAGGLIGEDSHDYGSGHFTYDNVINISDCSITADVTADGCSAVYAGGMMGYTFGLNENGYVITVTGCEYEGTVKAKTSDTVGNISYAGGFIGSCGSSAIFKNCSLSGDITAENGYYSANAGRIFASKSVETVIDDVNFVVSVDAINTIGKRVIDEIEQ
ncbi:MAG: S8 family serine peptidase [Clostridia bacterium]|nr:S8 family serine peptidase [Clostridia bacterium]